VEKKHISGHEVLVDMQSGMDDDALMAKYKLSPNLFEMLCKRLVDTCRLTPFELSELKLLWAQKKGKVWRCPACHMPQYHQFDECPQCGIIVSKYEQKLSREKGLNKPEEFIEVPPTESEAPSVALDQDTVEKQQPPIRECTGCSMPLPPDAKFCPSCGTRVTG
jgi:hypothetical protein